MQNIGIIGLGGVSSRHLEAIEKVESARLVASSDIDGEKLARAQEQYGCRGYADYRDLVEDEEVDLVVVCLPHFLHLEATVAALEAGRHVLVEKPMAVDVEQCDRMIEVAERADRLLSVGHMHHFFPHNLAVKRLLDQKELGDLVMIRDEGYRPFGLQRAAWYLDAATQGGLWYQNGIHLIDRSCWWTGSPVQAVKAMIGSRFYEFSADDVAVALLHFENGVYSTLIHVWWQHGATKSNTDFVCTEGMIGLDDQVRIGRSGTYEHYEVDESYDAFARQLESFIAAVENHTPPEVTPAYARDLVRVMAACKESARTGREVVL